MSTTMLSEPVGKHSLVPKKLLVEIHDALTLRVKSCADKWGGDELSMARVMLPTQYHAVDLILLKNDFVNVRKNKNNDVKVRHPGMSRKKGSRRAKKLGLSKEYLEYIGSLFWKEKRKEFLEYWEYRCSSCKNAGTASVPLDVHHNTYERLGNEKHNDCIVLCRKCHDLLHRAK